MRKSRSSRELTAAREARDPMEPRIPRELRAPRKLVVLRGAREPLVPGGAEGIGGAFSCCSQPSESLPALATRFRR